jgi:uncharacterized CHY-type Zn-finger protein
MSEHILRIGLSELKVVRIVCVACGAVLEVSMDKLMRQENSCAYCQAPFGQVAKQFQALENAAAILESQSDKLRVEFVIAVGE